MRSRTGVRRRPRYAATPCGPPITPLACGVVKQGATVTTAHIDDHLGTRFAKWWVPDALVFMDAVPKTSVGKCDT